MTEVNSILIIRLSAIGDVVMASPLIKAARRRYPQARIAWLAQPEVKGLLEQDPDLDEVIVWPRSEWRRLWKERHWWALICEVRRFRRMLQAYQFDLVVDVQGLMKSAVLARLSGARERIGLGSKEGSARLMRRVIPKPEKSLRIGSEYLHIARELGWDVSDFEMDIALGPEDEAFVKEFIGQKRLENGYVVFCPFTTRPQKHWFEDRWVTLASRIDDKFGLPIVMLGGPGDKEAAGRIESLAGQGLMNLTGQTSLRQAAALIKHAKGLIGVDTGLSHMGIAFNTPTVNLFGSTAPYLDTTRDNAVVIYHAMSCSPCRRNPVCDGDFTCMRKITEDEVIDTLSKVMQ